MLSISPDFLARRLPWIEEGDTRVREIRYAARYGAKPVNERNRRNHRIAVGPPVWRVQSGASPRSRRIKGDNPAIESCEDLTLKLVTQERAPRGILVLDLPDSDFDF